MAKTRVLICSDDARSDSGFGRVTREIGARLMQTGKYEIWQHAWFSKDLDRPIPFDRIVPTMRDKNAAGIWFFPPEDVYGSVTFHEIIPVFRPHVVLGIGNVDMLHAPRTSPTRGSYRFIMYHPIDGPLLIEDFWKEAYSQVDRLVFFCPWAAETAREYVDIPQADVIPHGVNSKIFYPLPERERMKLKKATFGDSKAFVLGYAGRNTIRKRADIFITVAGMTRHGWTLGKDMKGEWTHPPIKNLHVLMHCKLEDKMGPDLTKIIHGMDIKDVLHVTDGLNIGQGVPNEELNKIYNTMDVFFSPGVEGWGLCVLEAMAAGVPVITVDGSAVPDWAGDACMKVDPVAWVSADSGCVRPIPDLVQAADYVREVATSEKLRKILSKEAVKKAKTYNWDTIAKQFEKIIDEEAVKTPAVGIIKI